MKTFGLTGGIGMGKSTAADLLRKRGLPIVDSDVIARQIVEPGQPALAEVQRLFGGEIVGADGRLRRDELAGVFLPTPKRDGGWRESFILASAPSGMISSDPGEQRVIRRPLR